MVADYLERHNLRVASVVLAEQQIEKHQTGGACGELRNHIFSLWIASLKTCSAPTKFL
jgi:hypothetical protein